MNEHWDQVPIFGEHIKRRVQEGHAQGREEGLALVRQNISEILRLRFGLTNGPITRAIQAVAQPQKLQIIFRRALTADSLASVKKVLPTSSKKPRTRAKH